MRGHGHVTVPEVTRELLRVEILRLEGLLAKDDSQPESKESENGGFAFICDLYWPRIFGESCILDNSETGLSIGRIVAETPCELLMIHKTQLQTFQIGECLLQGLCRKGVNYPNDEYLLQKEKKTKDWSSTKVQLLREICKT